MKIGAEKLAVVALIAVAVLAVAMLRPGARAPAEKRAAQVASPDNAFVVRGARVFDGERDLGVSTVVVRDGRIVGAIGVSTGTIEEDQTVAEAGAAAL